MSIVEINAIEFEKSPCIISCDENIKAKVSFEVISPGTKESLTIKVVFVGSSEENNEIFSASYNLPTDRVEPDQILDYICLDPMDEGNYEVQIDANPPDLTPFLSPDRPDSVLSLKETTVLVFQFCYRDEEFARRAFLVLHAENEDSFADVRRFVQTNLDTESKSGAADAEEAEEESAITPSSSSQLKRYISTEKEIKKDYPIDWTNTNNEE